MREQELVAGLESTSATLSALVQYVTEQAQNKDTAVQEILLTIHPAFQRLKKLLSIPYRIFFTNRFEMRAWLKARSYVEVEPDFFESEYTEWTMTTPAGDTFSLKIADSLFDADGKLKGMLADQWSDTFITLTKQDASSITDDDIPF